MKGNGPRPGLFQTRLLFVLGSLLLAVPLYAVTYTVTSSGDSGPGTLRQAILESNSTQSAVPNSIQFNLLVLPFITYPTIALSTPLPQIIRPVLIDGTTQPTYARVELVGTNAGAGADGLHFTSTAAGSTVKGMVINRFTGDGIELDHSDAGVIQGCGIGVDLITRSLDQGNGEAGVRINNAQTCTVGGFAAAARNIISGNNEGVRIDGFDARGNVVAGNYIGTTLNGAAALGNSNSGVNITAGSFNFIGGDTASARNVISANNIGIRIITLAATGNQIRGNFIGTDAGGTADLGNTTHGISINLATGTQIGGLAPPGGPPGNVISGNNAGGVYLDDADDTVILGNIIGLNAAGTGDLGNGNEGIDVDLLSSPGMVDGLVIGGATDGARNLISGNGGDGIEIREASGAIIQGNYIGMDSTGDNAIGNGGSGIYLRFSVDCQIGGSEGVHQIFSMGASNLISGNDDDGIEIAGSGSSGHRVQGNFIGVNRNKRLRRPNGGAGVYFRNAAPGGLIGGYAATPGTGVGNVIAANAQWGIQIEGLRAAGIRIGGNIVGDHYDSTEDVGNSVGGILINGAPGCIIGGPIIYATGPPDIPAGDVAENLGPNMICGNLGSGIEIRGPESSGTVVQGNTIGADDFLSPPNGRRGNADAGVLIENASGNLIGGAGEGEGNTISGNGGSGIIIHSMGATDNRVEGNRIGLYRLEDVALGNDGSGIDINSAPDNSIGGTSPGAGNVISANADGLFIVGSPASGNLIQGNLIGTDSTGAIIDVDDNPANGNELGNRTNGVFIQAPDNLIGGSEPGARNVISGNFGSGVFLSLHGGNQIIGNHIGTDVTGATDLGNRRDGILLEDLEGSLIEDNLISGNEGNGVAALRLNSALLSPGRLINNRIGTDVNGATALGNFKSGVLIQEVSGFIVGEAGAGNVISGNHDYGVYITNAGANANRVQGNLIGTDAAGTGDVGNRLEGVFLFMGASDNLIGSNVISGNGGSGVKVSGADCLRNRIENNRIGVDTNAMIDLGNGFRGIDLAGARDSVVVGNVVSGNGSSGVLLHDNSIRTVIQGNFIGCDPSGAMAIGNDLDGVQLENAPENWVGGASPELGNVIVANARYGVYLLDSDARENRIEGNWIGTNAAAATLGNASAGIYIKAATGNILGGSDAGQGNAIAFNQGAGVYVLSGSQNPIIGNAIFSNLDLGIDLYPDGVTANDEIDDDTGANDLQNYPVLTSAHSTGVATTVEGDLASAPQTVYRLEFFGQATADPSGFGEGGTFIGSATVVTDSTGQAHFSLTLPVPLPDQWFVTSTATAPDGNTSEFSGSLSVVGPPTPTPTATPTDTATYTPSPTPSDTATDTPTFTATSTETETPTHTPTWTLTATPTPTPTATSTLTPTPSDTASPTSTPSASSTATPTLSATPTPTPSDTQNPSPTATATATPVATAPDFNHDGVVDVLDLLLLLEDSGALPSHDVNGDGRRDYLDLLEFGAWWEVLVTAPTPTPTST